jgi:hypothetical protein
MQPQNIAYAEVINVNRDAFIKKLLGVCVFLKIEPSWLMIAIKIESGFNRKAYNKVSRATGLIQWIPRYAAPFLKVGTDPKRIVNTIMAMSGIEQLELIRVFLAPYRGRMTDQYQTYLAIFSPNALGKPESFIIGKRHDPGHKGKAYEWNKYLDTKFGNKDGKITLFDIKAFVNHHTPAKYRTIQPKITNHARQTCKFCGQPI